MDEGGSELMEEWQQRVINERAELCGRITKLHAFLAKGAPGASPIDRSLLQQQRDAMLAYADLLNQRIWFFGDG